MKEGQTKTTKEGKCPKDGRENRLIIILFEGENKMAVADGKGHAYKLYGEVYDRYDSKCLPENVYHPDEYEFERWVRGMDF